MSKQGTKRNGGDAVDNEPSLKQARRLVLEEEQPAKDETAELKWRRDPSETYSDWTVEIVHKKSSEDDIAVKVDVFHVHKCDLACGTRRSDYFHRVFQNGNKFREGSVACSRIELEPLAAAAFPDLLDYCYDPSRTLKIESETALALHHLGEYFEVQSLRYDAVQFIQQDISIDNAHLYMEHAVIFHNDAVIESVSKFLGENISKIGFVSSVTSALSERPQVLLKVLGYADKTDGNRACRLCSFIVRTSSLNAVMDTAMFHEITKMNNIPYIPSAAAINFIWGISQLRDKDKQDETTADFASLEDRCATSLSKGKVGLYSKAGKKNSKEILLKDASKSLLVDTLFKSWDEHNDCKRKLASCQNELKLLKKKIPRRKSS